MAERLPRAFGDYVLERRLGVGGMAETFVARRGATRQRVCVKRVLPAFSSDREFVQQFEREARLAGRLRHSNVVGVVDFGAVEGELFLALELVEGVDLRALLHCQPRRCLREDVAALVALELAYALEYAHGEQVVHRDVTPSNVLLSVRGEVKLADFGVAKALTTSTLPTASGFLKGKVPYMAPEQMKGGAIDGRTDVFGLGVTLFEMLAGRRPFVGAHDVEVMMRVLAGERPRLSELVPDSPMRRTLEPILDGALAVEHARRPTTTELVQALAPLVRADTRAELARLVRAAFGHDLPEAERDTAFAPAMRPELREGDSSPPSASPVVPSTIVSRGLPAGVGSAGSVADFSAGSAADFSAGSAGSAADFSAGSAGSAADFQATVAQGPRAAEVGVGFAATAAARPGLLLGVAEPAAGAAASPAVVGNVALARAPQVSPASEPDPASASGVQPRAERFVDATDPTAPLRAPSVTDEPVTLPTAGPSRAVIVGVTIVIGLGALASFFVLRDPTDAVGLTATAPLEVRTERPDSPVPAPATPETSVVAPSESPASQTPTSQTSQTPTSAPTSAPTSETSTRVLPTKRPVTERSPQPGPPTTPTVTQTATQPPATQPATQPPATQPSQPPATTPPATQPPPTEAVPDAPRPEAQSERRGRVRVSLVPWGEVWIGDRYMGRAPLDLELPIGTHTIRIGMGGRPIRSERIRVTEGRRDVEFVFAEE